MPLRVKIRGFSFCGYDGIGRHARFRFSCREACRFDPCYPHHVGASYISLAPTFFKSQSSLTPLLLLFSRDPLALGSRQMMRDASFGTYTRWEKLSAQKRGRRTQSRHVPVGDSTPVIRKKEKGRQCPFSFYLSYLSLFLLPIGCGF